MSNFSDEYQDYETVEIPLKRPITVRYKNSKGEERVETIDKLIMREPDAGDLELIEMEGDTRTLRVLRPVLARLCNVHERVIQRLKPADYQEVMKQFKNFTPDGLNLGEI